MRRQSTSEGGNLLKEMDWLCDTRLASVFGMQAVVNQIPKKAKLQRK